MLGDTEMIRGTKPLETFVFAAIPGFMIYDWIYDPQLYGYWGLMPLALILLWLFAVFMFFSRKEPEGGEPSLLYATLAVINVLGVFAFLVIKLIGAIFTTLFGEPSIYE